MSDPDNVHGEYYGANFDDDLRCARHMGFDDDVAGFRAWIEGEMEEIRVTRLRVHRFCHYAGIYTRQNPCHCECGLKPEFWTGGQFAMINRMPDIAPKPNCQHDFDGPGVVLENGWTATCAGCGMSAMHHCMMIG